MANATKSGYLWIRNWDRFQHYKDKAPRRLVWIKFYVEALDDQTLRELPVTTRLLWDQLLLLAARYGNPIEADAKTIASATRIDPRSVREGIRELTAKGMVKTTRTRRKPPGKDPPPDIDDLENPGTNPTPTRAGTIAGADSQREIPPLTPPEGGNGTIHLTAKDLRAYTGWRRTKSLHAEHFVEDVLGQDKPPLSYPDRKPTREQVEAALHDQEAS